eukprot:CAMPEP_0202079136 /NCGR_PEP_ID=MMETSP0964-20121228/6318_1 /ASSEMBLY_ACC=CAM_ASM_000500 /TAXON_ID=4773 /ORGANISM="Schizochytrium aggregatum, Strain ATCC28209" /LENGTH=87 /DNA_ID=CAMNT_0048646467 /DNA_START=29 /DNA_END=292 /DNA_ORIENTATION=+
MPARYSARGGGGKDGGTNKAQTPTLNARRIPIAAGCGGWAESGGSVDTSKAGLVHLRGQFDQMRRTSLFPRERLEAVGGWVLGLGWV